MFGDFDGDLLGYFSQRPHSSIIYVDQNIITYLGLILSKLLYTETIKKSME